MNISMLNDFRAFTQRFCGKKCWNVRAGAVGSLFYLDLGGQHSFSTGSSANEPSIRGEFVVEGGCAAWRIDDLTAGCVLATSEDTNKEGGPMLSALRKLLGAIVTAVELRTPGLDCELQFDNGLALKIFPFAVESYDNYGLWIKDLAFEVGPRSALTVGSTTRSTS